MRILVIGGTRFIGPHIVRALVSARHEVVVFHRGVTETTLPAEVRHLHGSRDAIAAALPDIYDFGPHVAVDTAAYAERDAQGVIAALGGIVRRLVTISSADVYRAFGLLARLEDGPTEPLPLVESSALRSARFPYRATARGPEDWTYHYEKILVERAVLAQRGLETVVLRLPAVYGPGDYQHRAWPYLKQMLGKRSTVRIDAGLVGWRWTRGYVEDIAAAVTLAATHPDASGIYNVGEPVALTETEWIERIGRAAGWSGRIVGAPPDSLPAATRLPFDWRHQIVVDSSRIRRELGYVERVDPDEAMRRTVAWERAHAPAEL